VRHHTDTFWTNIVGGSISVIAYLIGGIDNLVVALGILMAIDYISGIMVATVDKTVSSKRAFKGLIKKAAMCLAIVVANQLDIVVSGGSFLRNAMLLSFIGSEGMSIIENLGHLGVKVPTKISKAFAQLQDKNDKRGE